MKKIIFLSILLPLFAHSQDFPPSKAELDLNIKSGNYELKSGPYGFCSAGLVGWVTTERADERMLMLGTRFIFGNINTPPKKESIEDCDYTQKSETSRDNRYGILLEIETRNCKSLKENRRRLVRVDGDKITFEESLISSEAGTSTKTCIYTFKQPSRQQQSIKK